MRRKSILLTGRPDPIKPVERFSQRFSETPVSSHFHCKWKWFFVHWLVLIGQLGFGFWLILQPVFKSLLHKISQSIRCYIYNIVIQCSAAYAANQCYCYAGGASKFRSCPLLSKLQTLSVDSSMRSSQWPTCFGSIGIFLLHGSCSRPSAYLLTIRSSSQASASVCAAALSWACKIGTKEKQGFSADISVDLRKGLLLANTQDL